MTQDRSTRAIAVMAKQPRPGKSKTRLVPRLGQEAAAELSSCMIADTVARLATRDDCQVVIAVDAAESVGWARDQYPDVEVLVQRGATLGERLDAVLGDLLEHGFEKVFAIGGDSPDLPETHLTASFSQLDSDDVDVVFGPTDDGGYYLIGWKQVWTAIVTQVEMSTPSVLDDSCAVAATVGARVALGPRWYDVDEPHDLQRLIDLGDRSSMPVTSEFLSTLRTP